MRIQEGLPERLKALRTAVSATQKKFAEVLICSQAKVSDYESGRLSMSNSDLSTIAHTYNVNLNWLVTGTGPMFLNKVPTRVRSNNEMLRLPVVADIAAGNGLEAYDVEPEEYLTVDPALMPLPGPYWAFRVQGDSMAPHIVSGDYAIVTQAWHDLDVNDHICAFRTIEGLVLKRFYMPTNRKSALLISLNPAFPILKYTQDSPDYTLIGLLVLVIRKY